LQQGRPAAAEPVLRECLAIRVKRQPEGFPTCYVRSLLGRALLGQRQHAAAEPLLLQGYEGMKRRAAEIPEQDRHRHLAEVLEPLVQLYDAWEGHGDEAARWRKELEALNRAGKKAKKSSDK